MPCAVIPHTGYRQQLSDITDPTISMLRFRFGCHSVSTIGEAKPSCYSVIVSAVKSETANRIAFYQFITGINMDDVTGQVPEFMDSKSMKENTLLRYVQTMEPETINQLSRPASSEVMQVMEHNVVGLLGGLPSQHFDVSVTTNRESLGRLLASAMMSGYFLRGAEQRLAFEEQFNASFENLGDETEDEEH